MENEKNVFVVTLLPTDDSDEEVFGVFTNIENVEKAINQFSNEIEKKLVENSDYEVMQLTLNKSNYLLSQ